MVVVSDMMMDIDGPDSSDSGWRPVSGASELGNKPLCYIKYGEFHEWLSGSCLLLKKDLVPWNYYTLIFMTMI